MKIWTANSTPWNPRSQSLSCFLLHKNHSFLLEYWFRHCVMQYKMFDSIEFFGDYGDNGAVEQMPAETGTGII
jgi:hypothetical protein